MPETKGPTLLRSRRTGRVVILLPTHSSATSYGCFVTLLPLRPLISDLVHRRNFPPTLSAALSHCLLDRLHNLYLCWCHTAQPYQEILTFHHRSRPRFSRIESAVDKPCMQGYSTMTGLCLACHLSPWDFRRARRTCYILMLKYASRACPEFRARRLCNIDSTRHFSSDDRKLNVNSALDRSVLDLHLGRLADLTRISRFAALGSYLTDDTTCIALHLSVLDR